MEDVKREAFNEKAATFLLNNGAKQPIKVRQMFTIPCSTAVLMMRFIYNDKVLCVKTSINRKDGNPRFLTFVSDKSVPTSLSAFKNFYGRLRKEYPFKAKK